MSDNLPARDRRHCINHSQFEYDCIDCSDELDPVPESERDRVQRRLRSHCPEGFDERIQVLTVDNGYCHCHYAGTCDQTVTEADVARLFCHPEWGGRDIRLWFEGEPKTYRFSVIRHLD